MGCGCKDKNTKYKEIIKEDTPEAFAMQAKKQQFACNEQAQKFLKKYVDKHLKKIINLLDDIMPFLSKVSEEDLLCLECCEKHLSKSSAFIEESKTEKYRLNIFFAIGQLGVAENHARQHVKLQESIREERLELQRTGKEPNWVVILELLDTLKETGDSNDRYMDFKGRDN